MRWFTRSQLQQKGFRRVIFYRKASLLRPGFYKIVLFEAFLLKSTKSAEKENIATCPFETMPLYEKKKNKILGHEKSGLHWFEIKAEPKLNYLENS